MRLNVLKLGLAGGILLGIGIFVMTLISMYTGWGLFWLSQWIDIYPGMTLSVKGALLGLVYGFANGFIFLFLLGWLYNLLKP